MSQDAELLRKVASDWAGLGLSEDEAQALVAARETLVKGLGAFLAEELKRVEPPLRSTPGPEVRPR